MKKLLIVVDMQNDFISDALGTAEAIAIVPKVRAKIENYRKNGCAVIFTRDTHQENYLDTQEGQRLPVKHCIVGSKGHEITDTLDVADSLVLDKGTFGSLELAEYVSQTYPNVKEIELCGLCTDICVVSNAIILKAKFPEVLVRIDASCCAGVTVESHNAALLTMKMCQVDVIGEGDIE